MENVEHKPSRSIALMALAFAVCLPGVALSLSGQHIDPALSAFLFGMAIVGAAFILSWAAEVIQLDVGSGLALNGYFIERITLRKSDQGASFSVPPSVSASRI